jgi:hypothetical protein
MWTIGLICTFPRARSLTLRLPHEPSESELDALLIEHGALSASVYPPAASLTEPRRVR